MSPASTSPAPAVASQGSPVVVTRTRPSGRATRVCRPFSRTTASNRRGRESRVHERPGLDRRRAASPSMAASSPACGVSTAGTPSGPSTWASASASTTTGTASASAVAQRSARLVTTAGADDPGLDAPLPHHLRVGDPDAFGHGVWTDVAHHPGKPAGRARDAQQRGPRIGVDCRRGPPRRRACTSGRSGSAAAAAQRRRPVAGPPPPPAGRSSPMSTRCTAPQSPAAGSTRSATLWVPKVTVRSARTCGPSSSPVSTSTPEGTSTATTGMPSSSASAAAAAGRSPGRPPMPTMPSTTTSGACPSSGVHQPPPAASSAASPASWWLDPRSSTSTATPRRRSSAPAYNASPPLSPEPTRSSTRRP